MKKTAAEDWEFTITQNEIDFVCADGCVHFHLKAEKNL